MMRSAFDMVSACASVLATTKSTPCSPAVIMLLTALPPAPPTPHTVMRGIIARRSVIVRWIVMFASGMHGQQALRRAEGADHAFARRRNGPFRHRPIRGFVEGSEAFAQPSSDPCHVTARSCHQLPRTPRFEVFEMRCLWVDKQACRHRKGRPFSRFGQTSHAQGTTYSYGTPQDASGQISEPGE